MGFGCGCFGCLGGVALLCCGLGMPVFVLMFVVVFMLGTKKIDIDKQLAPFLTPEAPPPFERGTMTVERLAGPFSANISSTTSRMIVAHDYPFARFSNDMKRLGFAPQSIEDLEPDASGTSLLEWVKEGYHLRYHIDSMLQLQRLEISGENPDFVRNDFLNTCYTPALQTHQLSSLFYSSDPQTLFRALAAAMFLCQPGDDNVMLRGQVSALTSDTDPLLVQAAHATLERIS